VKAKMGRPKLADGKAREVVFTLRLSPEERAAIEVAAKIAGKPVTQWARSALLASVTTVTRRE
jgi:uncharacterized protein (DUF1778 family)